MIVIIDQFNKRLLPVPKGPLTISTLFLLYIIELPKNILDH